MKGLMGSINPFGGFLVLPSFLQYCWFLSISSKKWLTKTFRIEKNLFLLVCAHLITDFSDQISKKVVEHISADSVHLAICISGFMKNNRRFLLVIQTTFVVVKPRIVQLTLPLISGSGFIYTQKQSAEGS